MTGLILAALHVNTMGVEDLFYDGEVLWAATSGGLEAYDDEGQRIGHVLEGLPGAKLAAVGMHRGRLTVGGAQGAASWETDPVMPGWEGLYEEEMGADTSVVAVLPNHLVSASGAVFPGGLSLEGHVADAVWFDGAIVAGTLEAELVIVRDGNVSREMLPGPVTDMAVVDGQVHVACEYGSAVYDGVLRWEDIAASAAGAYWGTSSGLVFGESGLVASLDSPVTSIEETPNGVVVGTESGLYRLEASGVTQLTPGGQICGSFLTGATLWQDKLVVSTFDSGACVLESGGWERIEGIPTEMFNDVQADGADLWLASSDGLFRLNESGLRHFGAVDFGTHRSVPGVHHKAVNGLAIGDRLWVTDVVGPVSVDANQQWRRHRLSVWGRSYQDVAACGDEAWVASEDAGVTWTNGRKWAHFDASTGLPDDWIMAVACDGIGTAWAGTYQDGVWAMNSGRWEQLKGLEDLWVLSLDWGDENLWVGTMGGLFRYNDSFQAVSGIPHPAVHDLTVVDDKVLVATEGGLAVLSTHHDSGGVMKQARVR